MRPWLALVALLAASPTAAQVRTICRMPPNPRREQSPVDIRAATDTPLSRLGRHYPTVQGSAHNDSNTVKVTVARGDRLVIDGVPFHLDEFHFHWPAEHELRGDTFPVEIHMVHRDGHGHTAVIGTWVLRGAHNAAWDAIWAHLPRPGQTVRVSVNADSLFSLGGLEHERIYRYCGSLTTKPYDAGITWLMRETPITMSADQIAKLHEVMRHPYSRGVQPLYDRHILYRRGGG